MVLLGGVVAARHQQGKRSGCQVTSQTKSPPPAGYLGGTAGDYHSGALCEVHLGMSEYKKEECCDRLVFVYQQPANTIVAS